MTATVKIESGVRPITILIHYREDQRFLVVKAEEVIRKYFPLIHEYFNYVPRTQVHFVFDEDSLDANGSAQVFPYNIVHLQDYPPTGDSSLIASHDWLRTLLIHEYTHIMTIEMTSGWVDVVRTFLGSTFKLAALNPRWYLEGIATWAESYFSGEGRIYHPTIISSVVELLNNPNFCQDFSCWDNPAIYPFGSAAYWLGAHFLQFVETTKPNTLACWAKLNSHVFPFFVNSRFKDCYGADIYAVYQDFKQDFLKKYDSNNCIFNNVKACLALKNLKSGQNYFKGNLETDNYAITILNLGQKGSGAAAHAEQLFYFDKNKNKAYRIYLPYMVEQLYQPMDRQFMISFFRPSWVEGERIFAKFNTDTKKIEFLSNKICDSSEEKQFSVISYIFENEKKYLCLRYGHQQWQLGQDEGGKWQPLYSFSQGEQVYNPTAFEKNGEWIFKYASKPVLPANSKKEVGSFTKPKWKEINLKNQNSANEYLKNIEIPDEQNYQPFAYFYPNHLMLESLTSGSVNSYGMSTSLVDPRMRHELSMLLLYNDGLHDNHSPFSGILSYSFVPGSWISQVSYSKYHLIFEQDLVEKHRVHEKSNFLLGYEWKKKLWKITPLLNFSRVDEADPYASRKLLSGSTALHLDYLNLAPSTYLKTFSISAEIGVTENKDFDTYNWNILTHREIWQWNEDFRSLLSMQYGKMYLEEGTNLRDGNFYGGGIPAVFSLSYPFPSYLVSYGNLMGSEILTSQLRQDWNFYYSFSGRGLVPFYLKSIGAIAGLEYLQGDNLFYDNINENDPRLWAGFVGTKFSTQILFLIPVDIELIYARSLDDRRLRENLSLSLQTSITF